VPIKATDEQILDSLKRHRGIRAAAAREFGMSERGMQARVSRMKGRGTDIPNSTYDGHSSQLRGTSTLYGPEGEVKLTWVKEDAGKPGPEVWAEALRESLADLSPIKVIPKPPPATKHLLTVYPIGDAHVGMCAWAEEVGADYDLKTAERLMAAAVEHLVEITQPTDEALIVNVGDFLHVDTIKNETSRSGNTLDVDTRYAAMIRAGCRMLRTFVECALTKHRRVKLICAIGNHDDIGAAWLALALGMLFEKNPRVTVEQKPGKFHYHQHGKCLIGVTHGDTGKPEKLAGVMAADVPEMWGATRHRVWYTGHVHTRRVLEMPGLTWETFRTLAPGDAWSQAAGYRSGRDMQAIVLHSEYGEVARHRFDVSMIEAT